MLRLGKPDQAVSLFRDVLEDPAMPPRNRAVYQGYLAASLVKAGDRAEAVNEGLRVVPALEGPVRSARAVNLLRPVRAKAPGGEEFAVRFDLIAS